MEFSVEDLNRILMDLFNSPQATNTDPSHNNSSAPSTVKEESASSNEQQQQGPAPTLTNDMIDRQYLFIIFNNPRWSQSLQRRRTHVRTPPASSSPSQVIEHTFHLGCY